MNIIYVLRQETPNPKTLTTKLSGVYYHGVLSVAFRPDTIASKNTTMQTSQTSLLVVIILACNLQNVKYFGYNTEPFDSLAGQYAFLLEALHYCHKKPSLNITMKV